MICFPLGTIGPATKEGYSPNGRCYKIVYVILSLEKVTSEMYKLMMFSTMTSLFFPSKPEYLILFYLRDNFRNIKWAGRFGLNLLSATVYHEGDTLLTYKLHLTILYSYKPKALDSIP